jgi:hypothetical protein
MLHRSPTLAYQPRRIPLQRSDVSPLGKGEQWQTCRVRGFSRRFTNRPQDRRSGYAELG